MESWQLGWLGVFEAARRVELTEVSLNASTDRRHPRLRFFGRSDHPARKISQHRLCVPPLDHSHILR